MNLNKFKLLIFSLVLLAAVIILSAGSSFTGEPSSTPPTIMVDADATVYIQEKADPRAKEWGNPGDTFLIEGTLYPYGTLDRETGLPEDPDNVVVLGKWSCIGVLSSHSYDFVQQRFYLYDRGEIYGLGTEMLGWTNENPLAVVGGTGEFVGSHGQYTLNMVSPGVMMAEFKFYLNKGDNIDFTNLPDPYFPY